MKWKMKFFYLLAILWVIMVEFSIYMKPIPYFSLQVDFRLIITAHCKSLKSINGNKFMFFDSKPEEGCNVFKYIKYWYMNYMSVFISFINMSFVCILSNSVEWWQSCWYWGFGESPNHQTNHSPQKVVQVSQVCERYQNFNAFLKNITL